MRKDHKNWLISVKTFTLSNSIILQSFGETFDEIYAEWEEKSPQRKYYTQGADKEVICSIDQ